MGHDGAKLLMKPCDPSDEYQNWVFKHYDHEKAKQMGYIS